MRLIFAGTPVFAALALRALHAAGHDICQVLTQPDRAAGRGMQPQPSPVKTAALALGIPVAQPAGLRNPEVQDALRSLNAEVMVVAAYGLILPQTVLDSPAHGCLNIHASLLPRWRGAAPIQRAILAGDAETGVCIMQMEAGLDTGPVLLKGAIPVGAEETTATLHDRLAELGAQLIVRALADLPALAPHPQPAEGVTYAAKIAKAEARLDWRMPATALERAVRAFSPAPGANAELGGQPVKIWRALVEPEHGAPGQVLAADSAGILVACGEGALRLTELQKPGGKRLPAADFLRGFALERGMQLTLPAEAVE